VPRNYSRRQAYPIVVRLRPDERARVEKAARETGKKLSEYVRWRILEATP